MSVNQFPIDLATQFLDALRTEVTAANVLKVDVREDRHTVTNDDGIAFDVYTVKIRTVKLPATKIQMLTP